MKVSREFVKKSYSIKGPVSYYAEAVYRIGLWRSELIVFRKYIKDINYKILDMGCGAGRVSIGLYKSGYHNIAGMDISKSMVKTAEKIAKKIGYPITFYEGDAVAVPFNDNIFDTIIFSFNGLMQIPEITSRIKALSEIKRVLKPGGYFIFTTHDRDMQTEAKLSWEKEEKKWRSGTHDKRVFEFGDKIINGKAKNEYTFLHFPDRKEIIHSIDQAGLELIEDLWRADISEEPDAVKNFAYGCRFWITRKM